jgi:hypothetical protein
MCLKIKTLQPYVAKSEKLFQALFLHCTPDISLLSINKQKTNHSNNEYITKHSPESSSAGKGENLLI